MANDLRIENKMRDRIVAALYREADEIISRAVTVNTANRQSKWETGLDNILTGPVTGYLIMLLLLGAAFWLTISGANYPSAMLAGLFSALEEKPLGLLVSIRAPEWLIGLFVLGLFRTVGWVVSVMLPPMAIFFPLFTLMEDLGYLPRVAFNLDYLFKKCGTHGKQALTMCMGFGCNAAGVTACRIIDSPRERLIATLTNNFVPCNGRFPTLILMASLFLAGSWGSFGVTLAVMAVVLTGIATTLAVSWLLSRTLLKGMAS
ncbi:MAG: ferrous iron transporter B, partial [Clostridia bacterium]|nr:ferrous iron transporter B [Clostridia bacterium]